MTAWILLAACSGASDTDLSATEARLLAALEASEAANAALAARVTALEVSIADHDQLLENNANHLAALDTTTSTLLVDVDTVTDGLADLTGEVDALDTRATADLEGLDERLSIGEAGLTSVSAWQAKVEPLFDYVTVDTSADTVTFEGANVLIQSGSGTTEGTVNGLGNLIVGYNESTSGGLQTGSHNLIVGPEHVFVSYGAIVAGYSNRSDGAYASVLGGYSNAATGTSATVLGGYANNASGDYATVAGGGANDASGDYSSVLAGYGNAASASNSAVVAGDVNKATGGSAAVLGGYKNTASGFAATVYGGQSQTASTSYAYKP